MKKMEEVIRQADHKCKQNGSRLTIKRKYVLSALVASPKALSAYEVVDFCRDNFEQTIPVMSVYRILEFLQEERLAHKLNLANKYVACSHISCDHIHEVPQFLICGKCYIVKEISIQKSILTKLQKNVEESQFHLVSPQLEMNCICKDCFKKSA